MLIVFLAAECFTKCWYYAYCLYPSSNGSQPNQTKFPGFVSVR